MPSQSSLDGEAIPDHWIQTGSPDLAKTVGVIERETLDWVDGLKREMIAVMKRMKVREFFIFLIFYLGFFKSVKNEKKEKWRVFLLLCLFM